MHDLLQGTGPDTPPSPHTSVRRTLATEHAPRSRSFARTQARNANDTEIDFPINRGSF